MLRHRYDESADRAAHVAAAGDGQERFARLESKVDHIESVVTELKADSRALSAKIDAIKDAISSIHTSRALDKLWWMTVAAGLLTVMARAFKWI